MTDSIKVSILCTAYNHEKYLRSALDGFLAQRTNFAFEVLVNDDVSGDGTGDIIREYAAKHPDIIIPFYQSKNLHSQGIDIYESVFYPKARGEYLAFCEGDDFWPDTDKLQLQVDFLDANPEYSSCVHGSYQRLCNSDEPDRIYIKRQEDCDLSCEDILKGMNQAYHTSSLVARRSALLPLPDFYYIGVRHSFGDYPQALWLAMNGKTRFLSGPMSVYRIKSGSGSWTSKVGAGYDRLTDFVAGEIDVLKHLRPQAPEDWLEAVDDTLLRREYELLYLQGRVEQLVKPPYLRLYREEGLTFRLKTFVKLHFPALHRLHRRRKGFGQED